MNYSDLFNLNNDLRAIVESKFDDFRISCEDAKQAYLAFAFGKAYKTHTATMCLCKVKYGQDAAILVRSLFELALQALYITEDSTGDRINRWLSYDWVIRDRWFKKASSNSKYASILQSKKDEYPETDWDDIAERAKEASTRYKFKACHGWSDKNFREMAEAVGMADTYDAIYDLLCNFHHSGVRIVNEYVSQGDQGIKIDSGPSEKWVEESLFSAFIFFIMIANKWNDAFGLGLDSRLKDIFKRFKAATE